MAGPFCFVKVNSTFSTVEPALDGCLSKAMTPITVFVP